MMMRMLLTTTAVALLLSAPAMAQNNAVQPPASTLAPNANVSDLLAKGYQVADSDDLATKIIGAPVYTSAANDADRIGDINDIVVTKDGKIGAVVIGVGGFLGIGEKNVAVNFADLQFTTAQDNTERYVLPTTKDALSAAAEFTWREDKPANTAIAANPNPQLNNAPAMAPTAPANPSNVAATPAPPVTQAAPAVNPNAPVPGAVDIKNLNAVDAGTLTAEKLKDIDVIGSDNQKIAEVSDIVLTADGKVDALLVDFGGFLGIGKKTVAVGMDNLKFMQDSNGKLFLWVPATKDQLDQAPQYDENTYAQNRAGQRFLVKG